MAGGLFDSTIRLLGNAANLRQDRHSLISSNLANIETPNYRTKDISFEQQLQAAVPERGQLKLAHTNARHLPVYDATGRVKPMEITGGDVDIDQQMARLAENNLLYNAMIQFLGRRYRGLKEVIEQGGR